MKSLSPEEAIAILSDMKIDIPVPKAAVTQIKRNVALDMAISALSCSEIPNSSDTISRQAAIDDAHRQIWYRMNPSMKDRIDEWLKALPSAQPECKRGKWIHDGYDIPHGIDWMHCSVCGRREPYVPAAMTNYCPNFGADMREVNE